jgi:hypothetical protein
MARLAPKKSGAMKASENAFRTLVENGSRETNIKKKMLSQRSIRSARRIAWYMIW